MIIIPIPKSASSSLFYTLSRFLSYYGILESGVLDFRSKRYLHIVDDSKNNYQKGFYWDRITSNDYKFIHKWHPDCVEINKNDIIEISRKNRLYKNHILPTRNNLILLNDVKKVILLRDYHDVIFAYRRAFIRGIPRINFFNVYDNFRKDMTESEWLEESERLGIVDDLKLFYNNWSDYDGECLKITYNSVINNTTDTINKILKYYEINFVLKDIELLELLYTRNKVGTHRFRA
jgi:hypothetical protein